jgi:hypothetical protein
MPLRARFIPRNPKKYRGDPDKIWARSSWEVSVMKFFDSHPDIIEWGSEEISIPYLSPEDNRVHHYFPDFYVLYRDKNGVEHKEICEIKPLHEADAKKAKSDFSKKRLRVNQAKWEAAIIYCEAHGVKFRVLTEKSIFYGGNKNGAV